MKRYSRTAVIGGQYRGSARYRQQIYNAVNNGVLVTEQRIMKQGERLDTIAGKFYGNSSYWWVIAAASGIGWGLQVPPGTVLNIPVSIDKVRDFLGI